MRGRSTVSGFGLQESLSEQESFRVDVDDLTPGQDQLLREAGGRVPEVRCDGIKGPEVIYS